MINIFRHDFDKEHGGRPGPCNKEGLMSYGERPDKWSECSNKDFTKWWRKMGHACVKEVSEISTQQPEISKILIFYQRLHLRTQTIMQKKNLVYILEFDILIQLNSSFNDNYFSVISKQDYLYIHVQYN